jgi:hypothetical protein
VTNAFAVKFRCRPLEQVHRAFARTNPSQVPSIHRQTLIPIFPAASPAWPSRRSESVFQLKVEKVVKLPRKPVKIASRVTSENQPFDSAIAKRNPNRKHPKVFTVSIPQGKGV